MQSELEILETEGPFHHVSVRADSHHPLFYLKPPVYNIPSNQPPDAVSYLPNSVSCWEWLTYGWQDSGILCPLISNWVWWLGRPPDDEKGRSEDCILMGLDWLYALRKGQRCNGHPSPSSLLSPDSVISPSLILKPRGGINSLVPHPISLQLWGGFYVLSTHP